MNYYLVCYDIEDDRRRSKLALCLEGWGLRVQYSVFEVACAGEADYQRLCHDLRRHRENGDSIRIYHFTTATRQRSGELDGAVMERCPAIRVV